MKYYIAYYILFDTMEVINTFANRKNAIDAVVDHILENEKDTQNPDFYRKELSEMEMVVIDGWLSYGVAEIEVPKIS